MYTSLFLLILLDYVPAIYIVSYFDKSLWFHLQLREATKALKWQKVTYLQKAQHATY
jgi:hypothetical protein